MARACGLRIGPRGYEMVLLDGSAKRHKVVASEAGALELKADPEGASEVLMDLAKRHDIPSDNLRVVIEGGLAAFRKVGLPVNDDDKIEKVVKFEVESELPQFNIEDVVVDWVRLSSSKDSCTLLTTIVKKKDLESVISVCEKGNVEPLEVDVDTSAIVNAASAAGAFDPESAQLVVFIGEESSSIAIIDGGELRELRSIKQGAMTHLPGQVAQVEQSDELEDEDLAAESEEGFEEQVSGDSHDVEELRLQVLTRLKRELARSISGARTIQPLQKVLVAGYDMPGLIGEDILDTPVEELSGLPDTASSASRCAAAYGAAVAQLGGGLVESGLRREELRFTGTLERLELPLAVAGLLLVTLLGVWNIRMNKDWKQVNDGLLLWRESAVAFMNGDPKNGVRGNLEYAPPVITKYIERTTGQSEPRVYRDDEERSRFQQLTYIRGKLQMEIDGLKRDLGQGGDITQPQSALKGLTYVLDVLEATKEDGARPSLRTVKADFMKGTNSRPDRVIVSLGLTFFADDTLAATRHFENFRADIEAKPWLIEFTPAKTDPLETGGGISIKNLKIALDVAKTEEEAT
jgi:hypothetical protein